MEEKLIFTTKEASKFLGISTATIYRMEKKGLISSIRTPGGQRRFSKKSIEKYLRESQNFEAPQNPSRYKKSASSIKEPEAVYDTEDKERVVTAKTPQIDELFFHRDSIWIYNADFLRTENIEDNSIDLIVTSPPYNVDIKYNSHDDTMAYEDYLSFTKEWLAKCYKLIKSDGRFCLNIPLDKNKGGQQCVCADITTIAKQVGFKYHSTIIWNEGNISRRTAWGSWLSASAPYVIAPVELILVLYKQDWKKKEKKESDITRQEFMDWTNGLWTFQGQSKKGAGGHPAPFPIELPRRCIKLFSFVGDVVLDPFMGSGSTLIAAANNNRKSIGIDVDKEYCAIAKKRLIAEANIFEKKLHEMKVDKEKPITRKRTDSNPTQKLLDVTVN